MTLEVLQAPPRTTIQDRGRPGWAHLGVPRAGALDRPAADLANRLVGNHESAALVEAVMGGLRLRGSGGHWVAVTGAACPVSVNGRPAGFGRPEWLPDGGVLEIGTPPAGVRVMLAVAGGIAVPPMLGSRSTDTLAQVGPPFVQQGQRLPIGSPAGPPQPVDAVPARPTTAMRVYPGPGLDWFTPGALEELCTRPWTVSTESDRIGMRLEGPALTRARTGEMHSEPMVLGSVQVPANGRPLVFLADHPVTGGYPVLAVVSEADLWVAAQSRPGETINFARA
ncbi:biotin-dependent carboxyltransferase family protein [Nocardioides limicola]|uniref:5-oxoprolinase subunit C family protein n=1 Tax=Nocardioides limicola TaxID=2803368 RepID=UPI00193BF88D|nr:biotin-dependent carboxyltransferase family protein [Nocardioides sp. DJM-14]